MEQQFKIQLADVRTGIILGVDGQRHTSGKPLPESLCSTSDDAAELCCSLFQQYPWVECMLTNLGNGEQEIINNPDEDAMERYFKWELEKHAFDM